MRLLRIPAGFFLVLAILAIPLTASDGFDSWVDDLTGEGWLIPAALALTVVCAILAARGSRAKDGVRFESWSMAGQSRSGVAGIASLGGDTDVLLVDAGPNKIAVIKSVRALNKLGLAETKKLVESTPVVVAYGLQTSLAELARRDLEAAGATVELRAAAPEASAALVPAADLNGDPVAEGAGETVDLLERLVRLRDAGALTPAEFEEQKRQILAGDG
ncbi:MAG: ribosomal protein L7/L12 [Dehalococcoidia bacterium]